LIEISHTENSYSINTSIAMRVESNRVVEEEMRRAEIAFVFPLDFFLILPRQLKSKSGKLFPLNKETFKIEKSEF
jgi:hypothetical protein